MTEKQSGDNRIQALVIYADSRVPPRPSNIEPDFELYQRVVGGFIEAAYGETRDGEKVVFYVNKNGISEGLPVNHVATRLWRRLNRIASQPLFGNAVVVGADDCDDADLPAGVAGLALAVHHDIEVEGFVARPRAEGD